LDGFKNAGFIYVKNHGIPKEQIAEVFAQSAKFFELPRQKKDALAWYSPEANRGYSAPGLEKVSMADVEDVQALREAVPDLKESIEIGRDDEPHFPNMWPPLEEGNDWPQQFRSISYEFFQTCKQLHMELMRAIAVAIGLDEGWFDSFTDAG